MLAYIFRSLCRGGAVMAATVAVIATILFAAPVDPALLSFGQNVDKATLEAKQTELGLNLPVHQRVLQYLSMLSPLGFEGPHMPSLGVSWQSGKPVAHLLSEAIPQTFALALAAIALALLLGIPLGVWAALRARTWLDYFLSAVATLGISVPGYVAGMLLAYLFAVVWGSWTGLDYAGPLIDYTDTGERTILWHRLILPAVALGLRPVAVLMQLTRGAMLDVLSQDFVRTARAKGLSEVQVIWRHALPNALNPVITATGGWFASMLTGAVFIEVVFGYKGLGGVLVDHLLLYDVPVVLGFSVFISFVFVAVNLITDLLYAWLDPRVAL